VISYEEYQPYGTTAYRATDSQTEVSAKRYRYTGKEKDEETGLYYHGARYYAYWLGRWTAADPIGLGDGVNRFAYVSGNPVRLNDPGGTLGRAPEVEVNVAYSESSDGSASVTVGGSVSFGPFKIGGEFTLEKDAEPEIVDGPLPIEAVEPEPPEVQANREFLERQSQRNAQAAERAKMNTGDPSFAQEISNRVGELGTGRPTGIELGTGGKVAAFLGSAATGFDISGAIENPQRAFVQQTPLLGNFVGFKEGVEGGLSAIEQGDTLGAVTNFGSAGLHGVAAVGTGFVSGTFSGKTGAADDVVTLYHRCAPRHCAIWVIQLHTPGDH